MSKREYRRFTAEQKIEILREADQPGVTVSEVCRLCSAKIRSTGYGISRPPQMWHDRDVLSVLSIVVRVLSDLISWCGLAFGGAAPWQRRFCFFADSLRCIWSAA
jgi:hypothetical protein